MIKVYAAGVWDLFHYGHLNLLLKAKALGDHLTVGVCGDEQAKIYKGMSPIINCEDRAAIISQIKCVDSVIKYTKRYDIKQIGDLDIDIIVHGTDWENKLPVELKNILEKLNIQMKYIPYTKGVSTSAIKIFIIDNYIKILRNLQRRSR
ncbi:MAG: adenylyltransferase/cytidyltransferase family protein [candidate division Zixibacteria bacterium]|nr:adenylyltransferase/cytidyltransferase family protein [candidate division Zixibacteria bacterium]